jgi:hypothetical protein
MAQTSLNSTGVASSGALSLQSNGTTEAIGISTGQVATLAQNPILTSGTANGVAYLNGSKVLTTGSALVFDGTNLGLGVTPSAWVSSAKALQVGSIGAVVTDGTAFTIKNNTYKNSGGNDVYLTNGYASQYYQFESKHVWNTAASGTAGNTITFTQAMTLDASGRLGIGETAPDNKVVIANSDTANTYAIVKNSTVSNLFGSAGTTVGLVGTVSNHPFAFYTNLTERARIDTSGNLLVGATSGSGGGERLFVSASSTAMAQRIYNYSGSAPQGLLVYYPSTAPNNTTSPFFVCGDNAADRMTVRSNGGIANYAGNDVILSDRREKTNFSPSKSYLDVICAIPVQTFNYIDQNLEDDGGLTLGVVAQDVQTVAPELVSEGNWGTEANPKMRLEIYQTDMQYALMKALQELNAKFEAYKATHP